MGLYQKFETSEAVERDGVLLDYGDGVKIRVRRAGGSNREYNKALERIQRKYRRQIQLDLWTNEEAEEVLVDVYTDTVVIGWEGVKDRAGAVLAFNRENVTKVLVDLPDLFRDIRQAATNADLFRTDVLETDAKN